MRSTIFAEAALTLALLGCTARAPAIAAAPRPLVGGEQSYATMSDGPPVVSTTFAVPVVRAWAGLEATYTALGINISTEDPPRHLIGNGDFARMQRFNTIPLSNLVECGTGPTGSRANTYRVTFSIFSAVTALGSDSTQIDTQLIPSAVDIAGHNGDRVDCGSTGMLERMIADGARNFVAYRTRVLGVFDQDTGLAVDSCDVVDVARGTKARTTSTGTVSMIFLPEGTSTLRVEKTGYQPITVAVTISPADTTPMTLLLARVK